MKGKTMADAKVITERVVTETSTVTLTLDRNEALTLWHITRKVGGEPEDSVRGFVDSIRKALERGFGADMRRLMNNAATDRVITGGLSAVSGALNLIEPSKIQRY